MKENGGSNLKDKVTNKSNIWMLILLAACFIVPAFFANSAYIILVLCFVLIYIIAVSGLDINFGYCGQISMGHAAYYAIGAYGSGMLHNYLGIPVLLSMLIAAIIGAGIGALIAYPASKLVFHFLSLSTIAFGEIVYVLISHSPNNITGNYVGLFSSSVNLLGFELNTNIKFFYFGLICVILFLVAKTFIVNSKIGRAFVAVRENTHAAEGMGINVRKYKVISFAMSAFYTAFAGAMYLHLVGYIHPDTFMRRQSTQFITMLLFGGTASLQGPIIGAVSVLLLTEVLRPLEDYTMLIYGVLMLIVIVAMPGGISGTVSDLVDKVKGKRKVARG